MTQSGRETAAPKIPMQGWQNHNKPLLNLNLITYASAANQRFGNRCTLALRLMAGRITINLYLISTYSQPNPARLMQIAFVFSELLPVHSGGRMRLWAGYSTMNLPFDV
jgi:hypothetical protein